MTCADMREQIDRYVAGTVTPAEREEMERHLAGCAGCREDIAAARFLAGPARALPRTIAPPADLWPAIEHRIRPARWRPRLLAVAAALTLVVGSSAVTVMVMQRGESAGTMPPAPAPRSAPLRAFEADYVAQARSLSEVLDRGRERLAPETVVVLEQNLRIIDRAIADSRAALAADPSNPELETLLRTGYEQKLALLEQATRLARDL